MSDALLPYYRAEIEALQRQAAEFAEAYPKLAARLRLSAAAVDDPHVERLLEGVAFLGARVQHRLQDEFPELTDALLGVLYPHYLAPFPSALVAQFRCAADRERPVEVDRNTVLETPPVRGEACTYRTTAPLRVWPIEVQEARIFGLPLPAPHNPDAAGAGAVLQVTLRCVNPEMTFERLGMDALRLFLGPASAAALQLYELLCGHVLSVAFATGAADPAPRIRPAATLTPVGFAPEEALLPWPARSFSGFRLLSEYFAFPEKFLFLDFGPIPCAGFGNRMEVFVYLDREAPELVGPVVLLPGCAPAINLFPVACEPTPVDHTATELKVFPDTRRPEALEVWSVDQVRESWEDGTSRPWRPFYRLVRGNDEGDASTPSYVVVRHDAPAPLSGTEVAIAPALDTTRAANSVLSVDALCCNRDLPQDLPFGTGGTRLIAVAGTAGVTGVQAITPATRTQRPPLRERRSWRLISHLALGHLSVVGEGGAAALREVLRLYDVGGREETERAIRCLVDVAARPGTARVPGLRPGAFCRGLDVALTFEPRGWQAHGLYLMAAVLDRFLALHGQVNAFVRTRALLRDRKTPVGAWPPRAGGRVLL
jgi:type VI secretion system protein ImpG